MISSESSAWEDVSCPLCSAGTAARSYLECGDRLREPALHNYRLVECKGCGLIFLSPRPALELAPAHHLQEGYDPFVSFASSKSLLDKSYILARNITLHWKKRLVRRLLPAHGSILDVGCGTGEFLLSLKSAYKVSGIDPEPAASGWAREKFGLEVRTGDLQTVALSADSFDLVTMWHALEHISDPLDALKRIKELLHPGGHALIALPNISSSDSRIYRSNWVALDAPRHFWHFTPDTLTIMAQRAGLSFLLRKSLPLDLYYNVLQSELITVRANGRRELMKSPFRMTRAIVGSWLSNLVRFSPSGMLLVFRA